jgi:protein-S-isoprenylcysteine O-methyltransferase Ste14
MIALKTLLFTILVPGTVTVLVSYLLLTSGFQLFPVEIGALRILGLPPILLGAVTYLWCAWDFTFAGRGTPAPIDPPKELVVKGLYRYVRNPMYVGVTLILLGEALLFESAVLFLYAGFLLVCAHLFIVYYEEPTLKRLFGASYESYCKSVPRWIPRLP